MVKALDLHTPEYTEKFLAAGVYQKCGDIFAIRLTKSLLSSDDCAAFDIYFDHTAGKYILETWVMQETKDGRIANLEGVREVRAGLWIIRNPRRKEEDRNNHYAMTDDIFRMRYEPTESPNLYRARGKARIIRNETGSDVEIDAPWGGKQRDDSDCFFCTPYDESEPNHVSDADRYIISSNDFATYEPFLHGVQKKQSVEPENE